MNDNSIDRPDGGVWDRVWRGRASSHRRNLLNVASETARVASLIAEGARLVDHLPTAARQVEILGICDDIIEMTEAARAVVTHLRGEAGVAVPLVRPGFWRRLFGG